MGRQYTRPRAQAMSDCLVSFLMAVSRNRITLETLGSVYMGTLRSALRSTQSRPKPLVQIYASGAIVLTEAGQAVLARIQQGDYPKRNAPGELSETVAALVSRAVARAVANAVHATDAEAGERSVA